MNNSNIPHIEKRGVSYIFVEEKRSVRNVFLFFRAHFKTPITIYSPVDGN